MRSIRRTLIANFLLLLAVALVVICAVAYSVTYQSLRARQETAEELIRQQYAERVRQEEVKRDLDMLAQARTLAGLAASQVQWNRLPLVWLRPVGALTVGAAPLPHTQIPLWLAEGPGGPLYGSLHRRILTEVQVDEGFLGRDAESARHEYYQINSEWGNIWRSASLQNRSLPLDLPGLVDGPPFAWQFDELELSPGVRVRRVAMKAPLARYRLLYTPWWNSDRRRSRDDGRSRGRFSAPRPPQPRIPARTENRPAPEDDPASVDGGAGERGPRSRDRVTESVLPAVYVQCARDTAPFQALLGELRAQHDRAFDALRAETEQKLSRLRLQMGLVVLLTLPAVVVGGSLLLRRGLRPLREVSEAVSQVSEKDFRLPLEPDRLPRELAPIVDRLSRTLRQLQAAFEHEKQAVADISHELRTPLAALRTTLDVALRKDRTPEQYRQCLDDCRAISKQLAGLVERILLLAGLDAGVVRVRAEPVDLTEVLQNCAAVARPLAEANGLHFAFRRNGPMPLVTDPDKLREVILNLLHNAIEYNRPGGEVELEALHTPGGVAVEVRDTGIGIAPEVRDRIFERFFRADPARAGTGAHAGLGLAIVREYVERLGGSVHLDSSPGVGSRFRVVLPPPPAAPRTPVPGAKG